MMSFAPLHLLTNQPRKMVGIEGGTFRDKIHVKQILLYAEILCYELTEPQSMS